MSITNNLRMTIARLVLLLAVLSIQACHSSSGNDNPPSDDALTPALSESNWRLVVGDEFDVFTQAIYDDQLKQPEFSTIAGQDYYFPFSNSSHETYSENDCIDGGVATYRSSPISCSGLCYSSTTMLYACSTSDHSLLGRMDTESDYSSSTKKYDALAVTSVDGQQ